MTWDATTFRPHADDDMTGRTNDERANDMADLLDVYKYEDEGEYAISDALTDLMHLCHREGFDFDNLLIRAANDYNTEK